ncbi:TPA: cobalt ECF transporter T component CbiQ [bacterium]|nr:cobalt ECF transporter T component CbiQ [bacterium]
MHLPEIDRYAYLSSVFHRCDPRVKIVSIGALIFCIALSSDIRMVSLGFLVASFFIFLSRLPLSFIFIHLRWVLVFVLFFFLIMPLTHHPVEGLKLALLIGLRAISCVLLIFPMIGTDRFDLTLKALQSLRVPNKLVQLFMFSYRYIFVFFDETRRMFIAVRAKGHNQRLNIQSLRIVAHLIGMLLIRAYERTSKIYYAMISRGYTGRIETLEEFRIRPMDVVIGFLIVACAIFITIGG